MWEEVPIKELMVKIAKICADHKSKAEGGEGVGPAHQEKCISAVRRAGKPRDTLVDDIVIEVQEPLKWLDKLDKEMIALNEAPDVEVDIMELTPVSQAGTLMDYMGPAKLMELQKVHIEWVMFHMFICCALPWALLNSEYFIAFVLALCPVYLLWGRHCLGLLSRYSDHPVACINIWNTEMYQILSVYSPYKYSAVAGDGGPNVRSAKIKLNAMYPWILNIYDPCHNLNLFMKDIGKLFKDMLSIVLGITNYFGKSNYGTHHLNEECKKQGVVSVSSCMNVIWKCLESKKLKFDTAAASQISYNTDSHDITADSVTHYGFMAQMAGFIHLLAAAANGLLTLEGQNTNCADVFYEWVCIAYQLEQVLANPSIGVSHYRASVIEVYNHRFNQMMMESSHFIFLLAYFLHPHELIDIVCAVYRHRGGLQLTFPPLVEGQHPNISQFLLLGRMLLSSVLEIFKGEQLQLQDSDTKPLKWWNQVSKDSNAWLIGRVAIKVFSITPSEICDERTALRLGWFNAARQSSITPEHLVDLAKLYDFYVNGFEEGKSTHCTRVHLPKILKTSTTTSTIHSAPSILGLLNSDNVDPKDVNIAAVEDQLFNHPDPYDLEETKRIDLALQEMVVCSTTRFDVANYIKLDDPELKALITKVDSWGPGALIDESVVANKCDKRMGKPGDWSVDSFLCGM
ncbi:hypothetical protein L208DRAFT_1420684 [Tricholoma matsutake]|nr:hypothetical protein L208DRAFT_1420684 [Tricholoma matsutake 945]